MGKTRVEEGDRHVTWIGKRSSMHRTKKGEEMEHVLRKGSRKLI